MSTALTLSFTLSQESASRWVVFSDGKPVAALNGKSITSCGKFSSSLFSQATFLLSGIVYGQS